ncbi:MAG TPA: adenosylcobalamin-dependent ribonucleoside-diphosphate reductase [Candidatus Polarisedimenticolia bacterium]|nr:adenosylcobalamin-dependent ribonucleoside-diphosphate reductase [Candidatus Polarisedimenticolia bacterium]
MSDPVDRTAAGPAPLSPNALRVLERRYLARDATGRVVETPEALFRRVAENVAEADRTLAWEGLRDPDAAAACFYRMMSRLEFLPNSPTLMNAGRELQQLCACFVLPVEDSMEGIFDTLRQAALIHKTGGGTGFGFSKLRPRNSRVRSTSGVASGPVSFLRVYNAATEAIKQGGTRRGANMGVLRVDHPDILEFIDCKRDGADVNNFNISVALTDVFMHALAVDAPYDLIDPRDGRPAGRLRARDVFDRIVDAAWLCGDPGILFIDRINEANPTHHAAPIEATNPCGEQPLSANEACTLGSINLGMMVSGAAPAIDWDRLASTAREAVHFLDNVIEVNRYPLPEIEAITRRNRRIGVGVMGWADLLIALEIPYDSNEALELGERVMSFLNDRTRQASADLAADRGAFPNYAGSRHDAPGARPIRNATTTTIAPTGTLSIIAGASGGIEPLFAVAFSRRHVLDLAEGEAMFEVHPLFVQRARAMGFFSDGLVDRLAAVGSVRRLGNGEIPESIRRVFATAHDIEPIWPVRMQAAFQRHCDNAVSKTVNLPVSATREDVRTVYLSAYEMGCKGVTIYRDRSRRAQVLATGSAEGSHPRASAPPLGSPPGKAHRSDLPREAATLSRYMREGRIRRLEPLGRALQRHMREAHKPSAPSGSTPVAESGSGPSPACPDCGGTVWHEAGCPSCRYCGFTPCG